MTLGNSEKQRRNSATTFQSVKKNDRITDSFNTYGDLIRAITTKFTGSSEAAKDVVGEIFLDLLRNAKRRRSADFDELIFISIIARRHLIERSKKIDQQSKTNKAKG